MGLPQLCDLLPGRYVCVACLAGIQFRVSFQKEVFDLVNSGIQFNLVSRVVEIPSGFVFSAAMFRMSKGECNATLPAREFIAASLVFLLIVNNTFLAKRTQLIFENGAWLES